MASEDESALKPALSQNDGGSVHSERSHDSARGKRAQHAKTGQKPRPKPTAKDAKPEAAVEMTESQIERKERLRKRKEREEKKKVKIMWFIATICLTVIIVCVVILTKLADMTVIVRSFKPLFQGMLAVSLLMLLLIIGVNWTLIKSSFDREFAAVKEETLEQDTAIQKRRRENQTGKLTGAKEAIKDRSSQAQRSSQMPDGGRQSTRPSQGPAGGNNKVAPDTGRMTAQERRARRNQGGQGGGVGNAVNTVKAANNMKRMARGNKGADN